MKGIAVRAAVVLLACAGALSSGAWGPKAQVSVVTTAHHILSREINVNLNRFSAEIRQGALISADALHELYPSARSNPILAVETEMYILQRAREARLDPYFAWRLGALGKLVAETTSPLAAAPSTYRNLYFADVEGHIERVALNASPRIAVDPAVYFNRRIEEANYNNEVIVKEYQAGTGFDGLARATLEQDAGRSVASVADVWHTVLTRSAVSGLVSENQLQEYALGALEFYIRRGNGAEIASASTRFQEMVRFTADMHAALGDLYFNRDFKEDAVREYKIALELDPGRRDVVGKISAYLVSKGDQALQGERLEEAREAYTQALEANPLHDSAEGDRLTVERLIRDRDDRLNANREALSRADQFQLLAEQEALNRRISEAVALLHQSAATYQEVTDEFPLEREKREWGLNQIRGRINELKQELIANARHFSGSGYAYDAPDLAKSRGKIVHDETLGRMIRKAFEEELLTLSDQLAPALRPGAR